MAQLSLGLIETAGLTAAIEAADAAVKSANVKLVGYELARGGGYTVIKVEGDVGAVKAAIDAATMAASRVGRVVSTKVIPRPAVGIENMVRNADTVGYAKAKKPTPPTPPATPKAPAVAPAPAKKPAPPVKKGKGKGKAKQAAKQAAKAAPIAVAPATPKPVVKTEAPKPVVTTETPKPVIPVVPAKPAVIPESKPVTPPAPQKPEEKK